MVHLQSFNVTGDGSNVDYYPLPGYQPQPRHQAPSGSSGSYNVVIQPLTPGTLPYDSTFTGNNIPGTMESCHSYTVGVTVKEHGHHELVICKRGRADFIIFERFHLRSVQDARSLRVSWCIPEIPTRSR